MVGTASEAAVARPRGKARPDAQTAWDVATVAWLCVIPCAAIVAAATLVLGPALGRLLEPSHPPYVFLAQELSVIRPEPTEDARYLLLALCAPLLGAIAIVTAQRRLAAAPIRVVTPVLLVTLLSLVGVVVASLIAQYGLRFGVVYTRGLEPPLAVRYFSPATLVTAGLLTAVTAAALRSRRVLRKLRAVLWPARRMTGAVAVGVAVGITAVWMLTAIHSDTEIGNAGLGARYHLGFTLDETFAVLNGRTPLVNFTAQYGSLLPFLLALPMLAFGKTVLVFTIVAGSMSALALLAIYGVLRRVTDSASAALILYLPFLATSLFQSGGTTTNREGVADYYAAFPLRYALPFLLAWLTMRRLDRRDHDTAGPPWILFTVGGLTVLNNVDFGVGAIAASVAALLWATPDRFRGPRPLRLLTGVAGGLATAFALVSALTLARAGKLPDLARLVDYAKYYGQTGFSLMPIPGILGVHLLIFLTYVAAILVATVQAAGKTSERVLTGMLAWAGVFGLGAGTYWVGRSHPIALTYEFAAWAFTLALLTVVALRELTAQRLRLTAVSALVVLFGFGVTACSLAQTPLPWTQIARLQAPFAATDAEPDLSPLAPSSEARARRFVSSLADGASRFVVKRGAPVLILLTTGHRIADSLGVVNVSPYTGIESMFTVERVDAALDALRSAGGNTVILPTTLDWNIVRLLEDRGFDVVTQSGLRPFAATRSSLDLIWPGAAGIIKFVDMRHLHPRALR